MSAGVQVVREFCCLWGSFCVPVYTKQCPLWAFKIGVHSLPLSYSSTRFNLQSFNQLQDGPEVARVVELQS